MNKKEKLGTAAAVKGTMVQAHLSWATERFGDAPARLRPHVAAECAPYLDRGILATDWIPFRCLVAIDRAIGVAVGGDAEKVYRDLGRHSATSNLSGVYKNFVAEEPHRFFEQMTLLHGRFQNFGRSFYEKVGERSGRIRIEGYEEYSPVFCTSGLGYLEGALQMMKVPGPIRGVEVSCQCAGDRTCLYELAW